MSEFSGSMTNSFSSTVTLSGGTPTHPQYDNLPDTPSEEIWWTPAFGKENFAKFSARGKTWSCYSGREERFEKTTYWASAAPYIFGHIDFPLSQRVLIRVTGCSTQEEAEGTLVARIHSKEYSTETPFVKPSFTVGEPEVTRYDLAQVINDIIVNVPLHEVDKAALASFVQSAQEDVVVEVCRPASWKYCEVQVTPLDEMKEGETWAKISLKEKVEEKP